MVLQLLPVAMPRDGMQSKAGRTPMALQLLCTAVLPTQAGHGVRSTKRRQHPHCCSSLPTSCPPQRAAAASQPQRAARAPLPIQDAGTPLIIIYAGVLQATLSSAALRCALGVTGLSSAVPQQCDPVHPASQHATLLPCSAERGQLDAEAESAPQAAAPHQDLLR